MASRVSGFLTAVCMGNLDAFQLYTDCLGLYGDIVKGYYVAKAPLGYTEEIAREGEANEFRKMLAVLLENENDARVCVNGAMCIACENGHIDLALSIVARFGRAAVDIRAFDNYPFRRACAEGHFTVAKWIVHEFALGPDDVRGMDNYALRHSCARGYLAVAKWLVGQFGLGSTDICAGENYALKRAYAAGHSDVIEWIVQSGKSAGGDRV